MTHPLIPSIQLVDAGPRHIQLIYLGRAGFSSGHLLASLGWHDHQSRSNRRQQLRSAVGASDHIHVRSSSLSSDGYGNDDRVVSLLLNDGDLGEMLAPGIVRGGDKPGAVAT